MMRRESYLMNIYQKILNIQRRIEGVEKAGVNNFHKYNYVKAEDIIRTMRPLLLEEGIVFIPDVKKVHKEADYAHVEMAFTLMDVQTGEKVTTTYFGEGKDNNDKAYYKAYTGAIKYYFIQTFLIPTGDDPENDNGKQQPKKERSKNGSPGKMVFIQMQKDLWAEHNNGDLSGYESWHKRMAVKYNDHEKKILQHLGALLESRKKQSAKNLDVKGF